MRVLIICMFYTSLFSHWYKCEKVGCVGPGDCGVESHDPTNIMYYPELKELNDEIFELVERIKEAREVLRHEKMHVEIQHQFLDKMETELSNVLVKKVRKR